MVKCKILGEVKVKDYQDFNNKPVKFFIYGIFDTHKVDWRYYLVSAIDDPTSPFIFKYKVTNDLRSVPNDSFSEYNISTNCMNFNTAELAYEYLEKFRDKWETGSNNLTSVIRDKKIVEITN